MSDYTPSLDTVRELYAWQRSTLDRAMGKRVPAHEYDAEFNRWLAAHDAEIRESIATEIETQMPEMGRDINITDYRRGRWSGMTDSARIARGTTKGATNE